MQDGNGTITAEQIEKVETEVGGGIWGVPKQEVKPTDGAPTPNADIKPDANTDIKTDSGEDIFDETEYLKNNYSYESADVLKKDLAELKDLRERAKTPAEIKFANEETKKFFSFFTEDGKEDELLNHLQTKKLIEKAEKTNPENPQEATELLKTYYKFKYKDFNEDEVKDHFNDQYAKPPKPKKLEDQDEDEYKEQVSEWQGKCEVIDKRIIRDAKMVKPEFAQFKSQIVLPDIAKPAVAENKQPTQEELDAAKKVATSFMQDVDSIVKNLNEISVMVKDEAVEIPVSYAFSNEEKQAVVDQVKLFVESGYDINAMIGKMWTDKDGNLDVSRMILDLASLNSLPKITQKIASDAASKRLFEYTKQKKNIDLQGVTNNGNGQPDMAKAIEAVEAAIWEGKR